MIPHRKHFFRTLLIVVVLTLTCTGFISAFAATISSNDNSVLETVVITPGDTLWDIAVTYKPAEMDTRKYVRILKSVNGLEGSEISVGDVLKLPDLDKR
nr:LysM peptidoglycan-binding domain-containing protein [Paenibacillus caui]